MIEKIQMNSSSPSPPHRDRRPLRFLVTASGKIPSVILMAEWPLTELARQGLTEYRFKICTAITREDIAWADIVLGVRSAIPLERRILEAAKHAGRKTILALDDNLFDIPPESVSYSYFTASRIKNSFQKIISEVDLLMIPSSRLMNLCQEYRSKEMILPCPVPALLLDRREKPREERVPGSFTIGFSGGLDSAVYLNNLLQKPLLEIKNSYGAQLKLEFFGARPDYLKQVDGIALDYQDDYDQYRKCMWQRGWDIGLAPLFDTPFHRCKFYNKFLEYGALGIAGIYSKTQPYTDIVKDGHNGLLVDNHPDAWKEALCHLLDDEQLRKTLGSQAMKDVESGHSASIILKEWKSILTQNGFKSAPDRNGEEIRFYPYGRKSFIGRVRNFVDLYGWESPFRSFQWLLWKIGLRAKPI